MLSPIVAAQNEIAIVSKGKYDFERIVAIKVNKVKKLYGYYCLIENYYKYVFVPLDFPIDKISESIAENQVEETIE